MEQLGRLGPKFAMALLLRALKSGEPFVTYGAIREELEHQLAIPKIFPTRIGHVAGTLMDQILAIDPKAPLINVLITRANGIPGTGVGSYLAHRYKNKNLLNWNKLSNRKKLSIVELERKKILRYTKWNEINRRLFGSKVERTLRDQTGNEHDYAASPRFGCLPESKEHKRLKEWVANNPKQIGLSETYGKGKCEQLLLSGDEVDVMFSNDTSFRAVEVKSIRSNDADFRRGIYQCVKYREVRLAEQLPFIADVEAILVTERPLSPELQERARTLGITFKQVKVN